MNTTTYSDLHIEFGGDSGKCKAATSKLVKNNSMAAAIVS